ncbi:MAG: hypothetical protein QM773_17710 [Hyphomonadaceae bacterium]
MRDDSRPPSKKTEMIEVRVSHETKRDFLAACRREGRTASDVIREALDGYIAGGGRFPDAAPATKSLLTLIPKPLRRKRYLAIGAAAASLTVLAALPSAAQSRTAPACNRFQQLDHDGDGKLSFDEFNPGR